MKKADREWPALYRRLIAGAWLIAVTIFLVACGGGDASPSVSPAQFSGLGFHRDITILRGSNPKGSRFSSAISRDPWKSPQVDQDVAIRRFQAVT